MFFFVCAENNRQRNRLIILYSSNFNGPITTRSGHFFSISTFGSRSTFVVKWKLLPILVGNSLPFRRRINDQVNCTISTRAPTNHRVDPLATSVVGRESHHIILIHPSLFAFTYLYSTTFTFVMRGHKNANWLTVEVNTSAITKNNNNANNKLLN